MNAAAQKCFPLGAGGRRRGTDGAKEAGAPAKSGRRRSQKGGGCASSDGRVALSAAVRVRRERGGNTGDVQRGSGAAAGEREPERAIDVRAVHGGKRDVDRSETGAGAWCECESTA